MYIEKRSNRFKQSLSIATSTLFVFQPVFASGIEVDNAATNQHTSIDSSANGTPVVNITGPNSNGVSHNTYINFNVPTQGTILNNSGQEVNTQLAGYIYGNENVKNGSASLILNEVSGTNRSDMNGYVEVAGQSADVIIANPNGITVNGGGFINTPKATLTTGKVGFEGANPIYDVDGGDIHIEGKGLDASQTDALEIYTQSIKLNAKLHANRLDVITGRNTIDQNGKVTKKSDNGTPGFGIDSSALGGIYAGAITLRGTEAGVGVNLPDEILAQDQLQITADGQISLGSVLVENKATLKSQSGSVEIDEGLHASSLTIDAKDAITFGEDVGASGDIALRGSVLSNHATLAAGVNKDFSTALQGNLDLQFTEKITNDGSVYALDSLNIDTGYFLNRENGYVIANALSIDTLTGIENEGEFTAGDILLHTEALTNSGMVHAKGSLDISTDTLRNLSGTITAEERLTAMVSEDVSNVDGTLYSAKGTTITAKNLDNEEGFIGSAQKVFLDLLGLSGNNGTVSGEGVTIQTVTVNANNATIQSTDRLDIAASGDVVLNTSVLLANGLLNFTSQDANLNDTTFYSSDDDIILKAHTMDAAATYMEAGQTLAVTSDHLYTDSSHFFAGNHLEVTSGINTIDTGTKFLSSNTINLTFDTDSLTHYGEIAANGEARIAVEGDLYNESTITAGGSLYLSADTLYNNTNDTDAKIKGGGDSTILLSGNLDNYGFLSSSGSLSVTAGDITNYAGIAAAETLTLDGTNLINYHTLYSGKGMNLYLSHLLRNNENAAIYAGGDLTIAKDAKGGKTEKIENLVAKIESQGDMNISAKVLENIGKTDIRYETYYYNTITEQNMTEEEMEAWTEEREGRHKFGDEKFSGVNSWLKKYNLYDMVVEAYGSAPHRTGGSGLSDDDESHTASWVEFRTSILNVSTPHLAVISSGSDLVLDIDMITNQDALISAVNNMVIDANILNNTPTYDTVDINETTDIATWRFIDHSMTTNDDTDLKIEYQDVKVSEEQVGGTSQILAGGKITEHINDRFNNGQIEENLGQNINGPTWEDEKSDTATQSTEENQSPVDGTGSAVIPETLIDQENSIGTPQVYDPSAQQIVLPDNPYGIYVTNPDPEGPLIESNPEYTNYNNFVSSDYMLDRLEYDAENQARRLGDAMYETRLVRDAVIAMTGQRYIGNAKSDNEQYICLMDNGVNYAKEVGLELGKAPTKEQLENLKEDLVWLEFRVVEGKRVLVPVLYLAREYKKPDGAHIHAESMDMTVNGYLANTGAITTRTDMALRAGSMINVKGEFEAGRNMNITTIGDIQNLSGSIKGGSVAMTSTKGDIVNKTLSRGIDLEHHAGKEHYTFIDETATIEATKGGMKLDAAKNIENTGADLASKNGMTLKAEEDVNIKTIKEEDSYDYRFKNGYATGESVTHIQSNVKSGGLLDIQTGGDANLEAANIKSANTRIAAESRVNITAVVDSKYDESYLKQSGFLSESASTDAALSQSVKGTMIDTGIVQIEGKEGTGVESAEITAGKAAHITSQNSNVDFTAKSYTNAEYHETRESILGGLYKGRSVDSISETKLADSATRAESSIIVGGKNVNLVATELETNNGGIKLTATENVNIVSGMEAHSETHIKEEKGLSFGVSGGRLTYAEETKESTKTTSYTNKASTVKTNALLVESGQDTNVIASDITAGAMQVDAGRDFNVLSDKDSVSRNEKYSKKEIGVELTLNSEEASLFAGYWEEKNGQKSTQSEVASSNINAGSLQVNSQNTNVVGSNIAGQKIEIDSENIRVLSDTTNSNTDAYTKSIKAGIEVGVKQNLSDTVDAVTGVADAKSGTAAVAQGLKAYDAVQSFAEQPVTAGVNAIYEESRTDTQSRNSQVTGSSITATETLTLNATNELEIAGSDVGSAKALTVNADNINIHASEGSYTTDRSSQTKNTSIGLYDTRMWQATVGYQENEMKTEGTYQRNSQLYAGGRATVASKQDTTLSGATIDANELTLNVGGDLTMESLQDTQVIDGSSKGGSISGSLVTGIPTGASANGGKTSGERAWVSEATGINGRERITVNVGGTTTLTGASITNIDEHGIDQGNLEVTTQHLVVKDIKDIDTYDATSVGAGVGSNDGAPSLNSVEYTNNTKDKEQITRATIGSGTVNTQTTTGRLNRDTGNIQEITKEKSSNTELYVSNRTLDLVSDPTGEIEKLGQKLDDVGLAALKEIRSNLPTAEGKKDKEGNPIREDGTEKNALENFIDETLGKGIDILGDKSSGIVPSVGNEGGYITQIATQLTGDNRNQIIVKDESKLQALGLIKRDPNNLDANWDYEQYITEKGEIIYRTNPNKAVRIDEDSSNHAIDAYKINITSADIERLGLHHVFTNGMANSNDEAINNQQSQQGNADAILNYNPSHGGIADMIQNIQDSAAVTLGIGNLGTGSARQTGGTINHVTQANDGTAVASAHSQGTMMTQNGMDIYQEDLAHTVQNNANARFLVQYSGSPVNVEDGADLVMDIYGGEENINNRFDNEEGINNVYRSHTNPGDPVSVFLGGNSAGVNNQESYIDNLMYSITRGVPTIANGTGIKDKNGNYIKDPSPHSGYPCVIGCGDDMETPQMDFYYTPGKADGTSETPLSNFYIDIETDASKAIPIQETSAAKPITIDTTKKRKEK